MGIAVLLVEDRQAVRGLVKELLASLGDFRVVGEVATEAEAKLWLDEHPGAWDLAIVDLILEQGTGMGVVSSCRAHAADARVVVFSDYATPGIRQHCLRLGADRAFEKHSDLQDFIAYCSSLASAAPGPTARPT